MGVRFVNHEYESRHNWTPDRFETGVFTVERHQMFSFHTTPEKFENATISPANLDLFEENSGKEIS